MWIMGSNLNAANGWLPDRHRPLPVPLARPDPPGLGEARRLVGHRGPGPRFQAQVHHRPRQHQQRHRHGPRAAGSHGPFQTLPARCRRPAGCAATASTYYAEPPYMIPANTAWLNLNLTEAPLDDPAFRTRWPRRSTSRTSSRRSSATWSPRPARPASCRSGTQWVDQARRGRAGLQLRPRGRQADARRCRLRRQRR